MFPRIGVRNEHRDQVLHITPVGGNVFSDLGFEPTEAAALKADSDRLISEKLAAKDSLDNLAGPKN